MNNLKELNIEKFIYEIRGVQVMLDSDLAELYGCKNGTKDINKAVKRNLERFPNDFYFKLTEEESKIIWFQIGTKKENIETRGGKYNKPYVFTEQGVSMLASVLRTENADIISVNIMRAFVKMRHFIKENNHLINNIYNINERIITHEERLIQQENRINKQEIKIDNILNCFKIEETKEKIFFNGQIYDAYSSIIDILKKAKKELIIVDNYADKTVLDIISNIKIPVTLIVKENGCLNDLDIRKYKKQYNNLTLKYNNTFHDRYFILDNIEVYHCGSSINHAGNKTFSINKLEEKEIIKLIINKIRET